MVTGCSQPSICQHLLALQMETFSKALKLKAPAPTYRHLLGGDEAALPLGSNESHVAL